MLNWNVFISMVIEKLYLYVENTSWNNLTKIFQILDAEKGDISKYYNEH